MIGFFGDIHGDEAALRAVLDYLVAQGAERLVCLGDIVNMFPDRGGQENEDCVRLVEDLKCPAVMGNHDFAMKGVGDALSWSARRHLASLPHSLRRASRGVFVSHASIIDPTSWWEQRELKDYKQELTRGVADEVSVRLFVLGHRHLPLVLAFSRRGGQIEVLWNSAIDADGEIAFSLDFDRCAYLAICGAVACPINPSLRRVRDAVRRRAQASHDVLCCRLTTRRLTVACNVPALSHARGSDWHIPADALFLRHFSTLDASNETGYQSQLYRCPDRYGYCKAGR